MGDCYLLTHPSDANDVRSADLLPVKGCSYQAEIAMIRHFAATFVASAAPEDHLNDCGKITMHSLRSWLATLCR